ncbi:hypothetical protein PR003_g13479 [Phytophthora rubi]|uniref:Uncharacterized protein n=1 Tax=Phytophthora rubi TaxID=129364 RepID=A0A6A4F8Q5_9STRA|nr:hypothetical protein PR003_g13479 [Phytophthora rubi]
MIAADTRSNRFFDRHKPMPGVILEEVRGHAQKWPRGRRSPPRGEPQALTSYDYSGSPATLLGTVADRYARGASVASRHGSRRRPHYQAEAVEPAAGVVSDQAAQRRPTEPRPDLESLLAGVESCQRLLDGQRTEIVALRARVQYVEVRLDLDCLRDRVWDLPRQLDDEAGRLRTRCSQGEANDTLARQSLERHLD